jgi:twitching motility protein PilT
VIGKIKSRQHLNDLITDAFQYGASDLLLQDNEIPKIKVHGQIYLLKDSILSRLAIKSMIHALLSLEQQNRYSERLSVDVAYEIENLCRCRINVTQSANGMILSIRLIKQNVQSFDSLKLPLVLRDIANLKEGLVLIVGAAGSGKSTTLAALLQYMAAQSLKHIVTLEDPIEFLVPAGRGIVTQKEIGKHEASFEDGIRNTLRQNPQVIVIGEARDRMTIGSMIQAAQTGHLVLSTLHAPTAAEAIHRMLSAYSNEEQDQARYQISAALKAIVGIRLVPSQSGELVPAVEVMIVNDRIRKVLTQKQRHFDLLDIIEESHEIYKMQSFDQNLLKLFQANVISKQTALEYSHRSSNLQMKMEGFHSMGDERKWDHITANGSVVAYADLANFERVHLPERKPTAILRVESSYERDFRERSYSRSRRGRWKNSQLLLEQKPLILSFLLAALMIIFVFQGMKARANKWERDSANMENQAVMALRTRQVSVHSETQSGVSPRSSHRHHASQKRKLAQDRHRTKNQTRN